MIRQSLHWFHKATEETVFYNQNNSLATVEQYIQQDGTINTFNKSYYKKHWPHLEYPKQ